MEFIDGLIEILFQLINHVFTETKAVLVILGFIVLVIAYKVGVSHGSKK